MEIQPSQLSDVSEGPEGSSTDPSDTESTENEIHTHRQHMLQSWRKEKPLSTTQVMLRTLHRSRSNEPLSRRDKVKEEKGEEEEEEEEQKRPSLLTKISPLRKQISSTDLSETLQNARRHTRTPSGLMSSSLPDRSIETKSAGIQAVMDRAQIQNLQDDVKSLQRENQLLQSRLEILEIKLQAGERKMSEIMAAWTEQPQRTSRASDSIKSRSSTSEKAEKERGGASFTPAPPSATRLISPSFFHASQLSEDEISIAPPPLLCISPSFSDVSQKSSSPRTSGRKRPGIRRNGDENKEDLRYNVWYLSMQLLYWRLVMSKVFRTNQFELFERTAIAHFTEEHTGECINYTKSAFRTHFNQNWDTYEMGNVFKSRNECLLM